MATREEEIKRSQVFAVWCQKSCNFVLRERSLNCEQENEVFFAVNLEDLLGLRVLEKPAQGRPQVCQAEICTFMLSKKNVRKIKTKLIQFSEGSSYDENNETARNWREAIQLQCQKNDYKTFVRPESDNSIASPTQPRFLVILNPFSGTKKSVEKYRKYVEPMFEMAGITVVKEIITERRNHAKEEIQFFDLSQITGIVTGGGDGIIFEVVNGLMSRQDYETAIKTPIGAIPTGSGNGLVASLMYELGEEFSVTNAAFQIIRGGIQTIDLATVHTTTETVYMFLMVAWGLVADVDIESEAFRRLGGQIRDTLGALKCIAQKKLYHGRLSYLPIEEDEPGSSPPPVGVTGSSTPPDGVTGSCLPSCGPPTALLPSLTDPVPSNWKTIETNFVTMMTMMVPVMGDKFMAHPDLQLGSGEFYLIYIQDDVKRGAILSMLLSMENGDYIKSDKVRIIRTRACRIEPLTAPGTLTVDGEMMEYGALQTQVHPKLLRIFSRKRQL